MCACELASFWQENVKGVSIRVLAKMAETSYRRFDVLYHFAIGRGGGDGVGMEVGVGVGVGMGVGMCCWDPRSHGLYHTLFNSIFLPYIPD